MEVDCMKAKLKDGLNVAGWRITIVVGLGSLVLGFAATAQGDPKPRGGVAVVNLTSGLDSLDPALDYLSQGWQIEYATCANLVNYPDVATPAGSQLQPEVAKSIDVSADGLTYTFKLRNGYQFSPPSSEPVTADAFKRALERVRSPALASPGAPFFRDVVSVTSDGSKLLQIRLAHPSGDFLARLAMPFGCAVPAGTPDTPSSVPLPSAGPYYISEYSAGSRIVLSRNPNYGGPRPAILDQILYQTNVDLAMSLAQVEAGTADYAAGGLPPTTYAQVAHDFPSQFFVNPTASIRYLAMNTSRPLFASADARQAVNLAINRTALIELSGAFAGSPNDQYIPPTVPGFRDEAIYPLAGPSPADLARANALVDQAGVRGQTAVLYTGNNPVMLAQGSLIRDELAAIGITVDVHAFPRAEQIAREGTLGEPFDLTLEGWIDDYLDPFDTLNMFLDGSTIGPSNNRDVSYFNDPATNAELQAAEQLTGAARFTTYGNLDVDLVRNEAPLAAIGTFNSRDFFSARVGCQTYVPPYGIDLAALCINP
jgi:peptide/nickel transport system substrate-binding protein